MGRSSKEIKCRSLTGPEKLKVLRNIDIHTLLPRLSTTLCQQIQHLWIELLSSNATISSPAAELSEECITQYIRRAREWGEKFVAIYQRKNVTPYIHAMINHVGEFMQIHGSIIPFTQQGLEKKNDKTFFRSSNYQGDAALRQIIEKQNRIEHLETVGIAKVKVFDVHCSNCHGTSHNRLTCTHPCKSCGFVSYCDHLFRSGNNKVPLCEKENN